MLYQHLLFPLLCALTEADAEEAHEWALRFLSRASRQPWLSLLEKAATFEDPSLTRRIGHLEFPNPIGISAGLTKNGEGLLALQALGPGFIDVGAVLPRPQPGNPRPRLHRLREDEGLINRMGFNSKGMDTVTYHVHSARSQLRVPLMINIGRNVNTPNEEAHRDYVDVLRKFYWAADMFGINISSPNTAGLRDLQNQAYLRRLLQKVALAALKERDEYRHPYYKPVLVKISPDLTHDELHILLEVCQQIEGITGIIAANTTLKRHSLVSPQKDREGGASGPFLFPRTCEIVEQVRSQWPAALIVGVGGVNSAERALKLLGLGADLVALYTGLVYEGPLLIKRMKRELAGNPVWNPLRCPTH